MNDEFLGAHVALFVGDKLLVILRDDVAHIPSPNCWDFPGGTRDGDETPHQCLLREVHEEVALILPQDAIFYANKYESHNQPGFLNWFFVAHLPIETIPQIRLGDEGQEWRLMGVDAFLALPNVVPSFPPQLRQYLAQSERVSL